jgi:hypothetical protein
VPGVRIDLTYPTTSTIIFQQTGDPASPILPATTAFITSVGGSWTSAALYAAYNLLYTTGGQNSAKGIQPFIFINQYSPEQNSYYTNGGKLSALFRFVLGAGYQTVNVGFSTTSGYYTVAINGAPTSVTTIKDPLNNVILALSSFNGNALFFLDTAYPDWKVLRTPKSLAFQLSTQFYNYSTFLTINGVTTIDNVRLTMNATNAGIGTFAWMANWTVYDVIETNNFIVSYPATFSTIYASTVYNSTINGVTLTTSNSGLIVNPIRLNTTIATNALVYNSTTKEIVYNTTKTFVIEHPKDESKYLVHACLEGPESGVYYRGTAEIADLESSVTITLPDYVDALATDFTVQITPIYNGTIRTLNASRVSNNRFTVYGDSGAFSWHVHGRRAVVDVEPKKSDVVVQGDGPYKWIGLN